MPKDVEDYLAKKNIKVEVLDSVRSESGAARREGSALEAWSSPIITVVTEKSRGGDIYLGLSAITL